MSNAASKLYGDYEALYQSLIDLSYTVVKIKMGAEDEACNQAEVDDKV